jgi:hypothetical protein
MTDPSPLESEDTSWKDGRLVLRRPEIPDSQLARMNVPLTRARRRVLSNIIYDLISEKRQEDDARLQADFARDYAKDST